MEKLTGLGIEFMLSLAGWFRSFGNRCGKREQFEASSTAGIQRKHVRLFPLCHSRMEDIVPKGLSARLVAFNLGYLPGGSKELITRSETTLLALDAAAKVLGSGGLISVITYIGHPGGREEYETVRSFATNLPTTTWVSSEYEILNRLSGPVLIFMCKR